MDYASQTGSYRRGSVSTDDANFYSRSITGQLCGDIFPLPPAWSVEDSMTRSTARIYSAGIILDDIPSKEQCEALIWTYLEGYHTIFPLFHGPSFLRQARIYIERYLRSFVKYSQINTVVNHILACVQGWWFKYGCRPTLCSFAYGGAVCWMWHMFKEAPHWDVWRAESRELIITFLSTCSSSNSIDEFPRNTISLYTFRIHYC
jgi:hypothetical protein